MKKKSKEKNELIKEFANHQAKFKHQLFLTDEWLENLGYEEATDFFGDKVWRKMYDGYSWIIQVKVNPSFEPTNPNCGVVYLYEAAHTSPVHGMDKKSKMVKFPERTIPIAHYVDTVERLHLILDSLMHKNIF